ncbi:MAG: hypothetical protein PVH00_10000 [Gemmatimonadota bacterium]|jgi:hypothetical protein
MSGTDWALWLAAAAVAFALAGYLYRFRELPGPGRGLLVALRGTTLSLVLLLLFDPLLPGPLEGGADRAVLLDASASMTLPAGDGGRTRWSDAVVRARDDGTDEVLLFGEAPRAMPLSNLPDTAPSDPRSRLLPALQAAAQSGARRALVITDGRIDDVEDVMRWLPRLGMRVDIEATDGGVDNAAITRVTAPAWVEAGQPADIAFEAMAVGSGSDSIVVRVLRDGEELGRTAVTRPAPGRFSTGTVRVTTDSAGTGGAVRFEVALETGDDVAADDARHVYIDVSAQPAGITIVSFTPDWEPRFLYPVLERSLGLPVRAWLHAGDAWVEIGGSARAGHRARDAEVLAALTRAEMVVLHGVDARAPAAFLEAAGSARRLLVFPTGSGIVPGLPLPPTSPIPADWYVSAQVPASPIASALAGIDVESVPPLVALRIPDELPGVWSALNVNRGRRGAAYPLAIGSRSGDRRWVVALGRGYWRWAIRGGAARATYERLWSALGGWLLEEADGDPVGTVAPVERAIEPAASIRWTMSGLSPDSVRLHVTDPDGATVADTTVRPEGADTVATRALAAGRYRWTARTFGAGAPGESAGELTVESASMEFIRPSALATLSAPLSELRAAGARAGRRPLHATAWPWFALIALLSAEWFLRRRRGLR